MAALLGNVVHKPGFSTIAALPGNVVHNKPLSSKAMTRLPQFPKKSQVQRRGPIITHSSAGDTGLAVAHDLSVDVVHKPLSLKAAEELPAILRKFTLHGKVAIVTGGGGGLGFEMAVALCEAGVKAIVILDVGDKAGAKAVSEIEKKCGTPAEFYKVDVRDETAIADMVKGVIKKYGSIDILVNSAGIADSNMPAEDYDTDRFKRLIDINLNGSFFCAKAVARTMIDAKIRGSIVFIASMSGLIVNFPNEQCCYNASKAGVIQLARSLGTEWAKYGIRVNTISPGYMDTPLNSGSDILDQQQKIWKSRTPQDRMGDVDELNGAVVFLASDASTYMTGSNVVVDGGYTCW